MTVLSVLSVLACARCAEQAPSESLWDTAPADRFAVITITHSERYNVAGSDAPQVLVNGFFARHTGVTRDDVLSILNFPDTIESPTTALEHGQCRLSEKNLGEPARTANDLAFVDLIDAGDLKIRSLTATHRLVPRTFPDIFPIVNGITYEGVLPRHNLDRLTLETRGSHEVGAFAVTVSAPQIPRLLSVGRTPTTTHYASVDWEADLELSWLSPNAKVPTQPLLIEVIVIQFDRNVSLTCAVPDKGDYIVSAADLAQLSRHVTPDSTVQIILRRIRRAHFLAPGIHSGEVLFVSRDSVILQ